jgi:hypothetical protein
MRAGLIPFLAAAMTLAGAAAADTPSGGLLDLIARVDAAQPADRTAVERLLGQPLTCKDNFCDNDRMRMGSVVIGHVNYRMQTNGALLVLEGFSECLAPAKIRARYPGGQFDNGCSDGVTCNYYSLKRPWGRLSIGVGPAPGASNVPANCVRSAVFDTGYD